MINLGLSRNDLPALPPIQDSWVFATQSGAKSSRNHLLGHNSTEISALVRETPKAPSKCYFMAPFSPKHEPSKEWSDFQASPRRTRKK